MIWLFERGNRVTRLVTRFDTETADYVLDVEWSDGASSTERFADAETFKTYKQFPAQKALFDKVTFSDAQKGYVTMLPLAITSTAGTRKP